MPIEYTPEEVRTLLAEQETLHYRAATAVDVTEVADVMEGVEELVAKLDPAVRRDELLLSSLPAGNHFWIPVARNCVRAAGVAIDPEGGLSFMVTGAEFGDAFPTFFSARQAAAHALLGEASAAGAAAEAQESTPVEEPEDAPEISPSVTDEDPLVRALKANGSAIAAGRRLDDVDGEVLARLHPLSEAGVAHLFATEDGSGVVLALAGSTAGDRRRAAERLATLPGRRYSSRPFSVLLECGEAGSHYSEEPWFGHALKETPRLEETELDEAAERFRAARFVRPSSERPLDVAAIRRRVRAQALVRAAVRAAFSTDPADAEGIYRAMVVALAMARIFSREAVRRALGAARPWDSKAERGRMVKAGARLRREICAGRKARGGKPAEVTPAAKLDAERRERLSPPAEDPRLRPSIERRRKSGRAAYDTARAIYLRRCPELERKLLHLLRRDGATPEDEFVSRRRDLASEATVPEAVVRAALRALAEAGKIWRARSRKTGQVFIAATEPLDETGYRRSLNGLIRDERYGIVNPWADGAFGAAEGEGEDDEWERGAEDLEASEVTRLAPRRLRNTRSYEQPLPADDLIAEPSAQEEVEAIAEEIA